MGKKGTKSSWSEGKKGSLFPHFPVKCEFCFPWTYRTIFDAFSDIDNIFDNLPNKFLDIDKIVDIYIVDPYSQDNWHYQQCTLSPSLNLHIRLLTRYHPALLGSNSIGSALRDGREKDKARTEWKNEKSGHQTKGGRPTRGMQAKWRILTHGGAEEGRYWTTLKGFCQKWSFCWNQFPMEIGQEREEDHHVLNQPMPCNGWYQNNSLGSVQIKPAFENFYVSPAELLLFHQNTGPSDRRDIVLFCFVYDYGLWSEDPSRDCLMAPKPVRFDIHWRWSVPLCTCVRMPQLIHRQWQRGVKDDCQRI